MNNFYFKHKGRHAIHLYRGIDPTTGEVNGIRYSTVITKGWIENGEWIVVSTQEAIDYYLHRLDLPSVPFKMEWEGPSQYDVIVERVMLEEENLEFELKDVDKRTGRSKIRYLNQREFFDFLNKGHLRIVDEKEEVATKQSLSEAIEQYVKDCNTPDTLDTLDLAKFIDVCIVDTDDKLEVTITGTHYEIYHPMFDKYMLKATSEKELRDGLSAVVLLHKLNK